MLTASALLDDYLPTVASSSMAAAQQQFRLCTLPHRDHRGQLPLLPSPWCCPLRAIGCCHCHLRSPYTHCPIVVHCTVPSSYYCHYHPCRRHQQGTIVDVLLSLLTSLSMCCCCYHHPVVVIVPLCRWWKEHSSIGYMHCIVIMPSLLRHECGGCGWVIMNLACDAD